MDSNLYVLAGHLEGFGLHVTVDDSARCGGAANPLNSRHADQVYVEGDEYVTSFGYSIGEQGQEAACAERIARVLAAPAPAGATVVGAGRACDREKAADV